MFMLHLFTTRLITKISTAQKRMISAFVAPSESTLCNNDDDKRADEGQEGGGGFRLELP